ncbi:MAG: hypothetical protein K6E87_02550 [bacterium]|nr:hypothetical protein [bacterium]
MIRRKNKKNNIELEESNVNETNEEVEVKDVDTKITLKKSIFYIFYIISGVACIVLLILTFFSKPREFIEGKMRFILGILLIVYALIFLLPYAFKKKENKLINLLTIIECASIGLISFILISHEEDKFFNLSRAIGLVIYIFGLIEIIRGYHSIGGVKLFKNPLLNGLIKYFNIFLITIGTYIFFTEPFDKYLTLCIRITLIALAIISIIVGLLKMPKKKKKE